MSKWVNLSDEEVHKLLKLIRCADDTFEEELYNKLENSMLSIIKPIYNEKDILDLFMYSKLFGEMVLKCNEKNDYGWKKNHAEKNYYCMIPNGIYHLKIDLWKDVNVEE